MLIEKKIVYKMLQNKINNNVESKHSKTQEYDLRCSFSHFFISMTNKTSNTKDKNQTKISQYNNITCNLNHQNKKTNDTIKNIHYFDTNTHFFSNINACFLFVSTLPGIKHQLLTQH